MTIRFIRFTQAGHIQIQAGERLDLPSEIAQQHIDDGNAVKIAAAEFTVQRHHDYAAIFPSRTALIKQPRGRR